MYKAILGFTNRELNSNVSLRIRMITLIRRRALSVLYFALERYILSFLKKGRELM